MKKNIIFFVVIAAVLFITGMSYADTLKVQAEGKAPEEYIVVKMDTLWDISDAKFEDPFLWPRLWNYNPHIENPDLIYPGTKLLIPSREVLMGMPVTIPPKAKKKDEVFKERTKVIFEKPKRLIRKYVIDRNTYINSGWITDDIYSIGKVIYSPMDAVISGRDNIVYLEFNKKANIKDISAYLKEYENNTYKKRFFTFREVKTVRHPVTEKLIGHQIRVSGIVEVTGIDDNRPRARVISSFEDIDRNDGLLPYQELSPPLIRETPRAPDYSGHIISTHMDNEISGKGDIIFLDKGESDGLMIGDVFTVYSEPPIKRSIGKFQVITLKPKTSSAVILVSNKEISVGASWGNK